MSLRAYQQAAARAETPKDLEYRLFGQVTRALLEAAASDRSEIRKRIDAIHWNRQVWSALALDCMQPGNQLSEAVRANIISLSLWVNRYSSDVMQGKEDFDALIDVNKIMMQALDTRPAAAA